MTWQTQPQSPRLILYRTGLEAAGSTVYSLVSKYNDKTFSDTERLMRNTQKVRKKSLENVLYQNSEQEIQTTRFW